MLRLHAQLLSLIFCVPFATTHAKQCTRAILFANHKPASNKKNELRDYYCRGWCRFSYLANGMCANLLLARSAARHSICMVKLQLGRCLAGGSLYFRALTKTRSFCRKCVRAFFGDSMEIRISAGACFFSVERALAIPLCTLFQRRGETHHSSWKGVCQT